MVDSSKIEKKWQDQWTKANLGEVEPDDRPKFFMIFAYPGISGFMHVGHMRGYSYADAICRYKRMKGYNVLFPVGTHASGNQAISFAAKVRNKDEQWMAYLRDNGCPEHLLKRLTDKDSIIEYFNDVYVEQYWKRFGFICDYRRFTSTSYPEYEKFIQWQFKKLRDKNLLVQKPYFATFCPEDGPVAVDPSETDISKGGKAEKNEYTLLKFKMNDFFLVAATLRPETVYGQTNLWINPDAKYVGAKVNGENWVMSEQAAHKLVYQKDNVVIEKIIDPKRLIGKTAKAPQIDREIPILPAPFVDPDVGSGIVTSVPSDAPFDYIALTALQKAEETCKKYGLDPQTVKDIKLIPIIESKGFGDFPAKEICAKNKITSLDQKDKLEEVTKEIYKAGFHSGILRNNCGKYKNMRVPQAKEQIKQEMIANDVADVFYDLSQEVICRCGRQVIIKRIDDQWFIKYSDDELTQKTKAHTNGMSVYPPEYKKNLPSVLDWFMDRACTRLGNWVGSRLPFDERWIVEPISDSTLYPIFYLVSKYVQEKQLNVEDLTEEFFDYVFLGEGGSDEVANKINVEKDLVEQIRKDVQYWYPLDINLGGKEHQTVHFPVFLMNHVAILKEEFWPKGIFINHWVTGKGGKISKSKGGARPVHNLAELYGVDGMRLYYAHIGSAHSDVVWAPDKAITYKQAVERCLSVVEDMTRGKELKKEHIDRWLTSRMIDHIKKITDDFEVLDLRAAASSIYFSIPEDLRWYKRRGGQNTGMLKDLLGRWVKMMTPITPHFAEECWQRLGNKNLVSSSDWPVHHQDKVDLLSQAGEDMIKQMLDDVRTVTKLAKLDKAEHVTLIVSAEWKYTLYSEMKKIMSNTRNMGEILKHLLADHVIKENAKEVSRLVASCLKDPSKMPLLISDQKNELSALDSAKKFIEKETGAQVVVVIAERSTEQKAGSARPGKPALVIK